MKKIFYNGQKVFVGYHYGFFFRPPKAGKVMFKFPFRLKHHFAAPYNHNYNKKCDWYFVKFPTHFMPCLVPSTCMEDCFDQWESFQRTVEEWESDASQSKAIAVIKEWGENIYAYMHNHKI